MLRAIIDTFSKTVQNCHFRQFLHVRGLGRRCLDGCVPGVVGGWSLHSIQGTRQGGSGVFRLLCLLVGPAWCTCPVHVLLLSLTMWLKESGVLHLCAECCACFGVSVPLCCFFPQNHPSGSMRKEQEVQRIVLQRVTLRNASENV